MAAAQILSIGSVAANSADVVVAPGASLTVCLKGASGDRVTAGRVDIMLKDDAGIYWFVDALTVYQRATVISAPGTYQFRRHPDGACGVFSA